MGLTGMDDLESLFMLGRSFWHYYKDCRCFLRGNDKTAASGQRCILPFPATHEEDISTKLPTCVCVCDNYGVSHE